MTKEDYSTIVEISAFKTAMAEIPAAVSVITCRDLDGRPLGSTLSTVSSLSLDPPMMLACFDANSNTLKELSNGMGFLVHMLAKGQENLAHKMAKKSNNKFEKIKWNFGRHNLPEIAGCAVIIHCVVEDLIPGGDHIIVTGNVQSVNLNEAQPMVYYRRSFFPI